MARKSLETTPYTPEFIAGFDKLCDKVQPILTEMRDFTRSHGGKLLIATEDDGKICIGFKFDPVSKSI